MPLVNLKFRSTNLAITADDADKVLGLAERFNTRMDGIATNTNNNATDQKLALMAALILEDELDQVKAELAKKGTNPPEENLDMITQTLDQVSEYVEQLAQKLERR
jgi:cell division protein ZapA (FtsZ GTPase activity inhibitor)